MARVTATVYLSGRHLAVTKTTYTNGRVSVAAAKTWPVPEGSVVNGVITDEDGLLPVFAAAKAEMGFSGAALVIDTSHVSLRLAAFPKTSKQNTATLVEGEFLGRISSKPGQVFVYDHTELSASDNKRLFLCCAVSRDIIEIYDAFFLRAGVKLERMEFSANAALQALTGRHGLFCGKAALICVIDHYIMSIFSLSAEGETYVHRSRLIAGADDPGYAGEVAGVLRSHAPAGKTGDCEFFMLDSNIEGGAAYIKLADDLGFKTAHIGLEAALGRISGLPEEADRFTYNLLSAVLAPDKRLNLARKPKAALSRQTIRRISISAALIFTALAAVIALLVINGDISRMQSELDMLNGFINNRDTRELIANYNVLKAKQNALSDKLAGYRELLSPLPNLSGDLISAALRALGEDITCKSWAFSAETSALSLSLETEYPGEIATAVTRLRETGLFTEVEYLGYGFNGRGYGFDVICGMPLSDDGGGPNGGGK